MRHVAVRECFPTRPIYKEMKLRKEDRLSQQVSNYLQLQYPKVIYHFDTGSGGTKSIGMAVRDKKLNPLRGYPDLFIAEHKKGHIDGDGYHGRSFGLFIELKAEGKSPFKKDGTLKKDKHLEEQQLMIDRLTEKGYKACFGVGFDEVKGIIDEYLKGL